MNGVVAREIVIEAGLGRRAERDLRLGIQLLDRLGHHMRRVMAQDLDPLRRVARDDRDGGVMVDHGREIARAAVDLDRDRRLGETGADRGRDSAPVTGPGNSRLLPSGSVTATGRRGPPSAGS